MDKANQRHGKRPKLLEKILQQKTLLEKILPRILLALYTFLILYMTQFRRHHQNNPWNKLWSEWTLIVKRNGHWQIANNAKNNLLMLIPFGFLISLAFSQVRGKSKILKIMLVCFCLSLFIESMQGIFSVGTFQFSDLFFNTISGGIGAWSYYLVSNYIRRISGIRRIR